MDVQFSHQSRQQRQVGNSGSNWKQLGLKHPVSPIDKNNDKQIVYSDFPSSLRDKANLEDNEGVGLP